MYFWTLPLSSETQIYGGKSANGMQIASNGLIRSNGSRLGQKYTTDFSFSSAWMLTSIVFIKVTLQRFLRLTGEAHQHGHLLRGKEALPGTEDPTADPLGQFYSNAMSP